MSITKIADALNKAQSKMTGARKGKNNPHFKSSYADLEAVCEAVREAFCSNGLSYTQTMSVLDNGRMTLTTKLMHTSGEFIDSTMLLPDIADPQKIGSAITYYRRYSLMGIAGIPAEDDDGNKASSGVKKETLLKKQVEPKKQTPITDAQHYKLETALTDHPDLRKRMLNYISKEFGVKSLTETPIHLYDSFIKAANEQNENKKVVGE